MPPQIYQPLQEQQDDDQQQQQPQTEIGRRVNELSFAVEESHRQISIIQNEIQKILEQSEIILSSPVQDLRRKVLDMEKLFVPLVSKKNEIVLSSTVAELRRQMLDMRNEIKQQNELHKKEKLQWEEDKQSITSQLELLYTHIGSQNNSGNNNKKQGRKIGNDTFPQKVFSIYEKLDRKRHSLQSQQSNKHGSKISLTSETNKVEVTPTSSQVHHQSNEKVAANTKSRQSLQAETEEELRKCVLNLASRNRETTYENRTKLQNHSRNSRKKTYNISAILQDSSGDEWETRYSPEITNGPLNIQTKKDWDRKYSFPTRRFTVPPPIPPRRIGLPPVVRVGYDKIPTNTTTSDTIERDDKSTWQITKKPTVEIYKTLKTNETEDEKRVVAMKELEKSVQPVYVKIPTFKTEETKAHMGSTVPSNIYAADYQKSLETFQNRTHEAPMKKDCKIMATLYRNNADSAVSMGENQIKNTCEKNYGELLENRSLADRINESLYKNIEYHPWQELKVKEPLSPKEDLQRKVLDMENEMRKMKENHEKERKQWKEEKENMKSQLLRLQTWQNFNAAEVESKIKSYKRENPSIQPQEVRDRLLMEGICNNLTVPSRVAIDRIVKEYDSQGNKSGWCQFVVI